MPAVDVKLEFCPNPLKLEAHQVHRMPDLTGGYDCASVIAHEKESGFRHAPSCGFVGYHTPAKCGCTNKRV